MTSSPDKGPKVAWHRGAGDGTNRHRAWLAATALVVALGASGSVLGATSVANSNASRSRQSFVSSSRSIAAALQLSILHEQDLMNSASGFIANDPVATNLQFAQWTVSVDAFARYPEVMGLAYSVIITATDFPAFALNAQADPVGSLAPNGTLQVVPPGKRSYYCLMQVGLMSSAQEPIPSGIDLCAPGLARTVMMSSRASGESTYMPLQMDGLTFLNFEYPVYQGGIVPTTVQGRLADFLGWVGAAVKPQVVLDNALLGHPRTTVMLHYYLGSSRVMFMSGKPPDGAQSATINLDNGWTVTTFGDPTPAWGAQR